MSDARYSLSDKRIIKKNQFRRQSFDPRWGSFGFVDNGEKALCVLCGTSISYCSFRIRKHFHTRHEPTYRVPAERYHLITKAMHEYSFYRSFNALSTWYKTFMSVNAGYFDVQIPDDRPFLDTSRLLARFIKGENRPLDDGEYIKEAFIICASRLFDDMINKEEIMFRLKSLSVSKEILREQLEVSAFSGGEVGFSAAVEMADRSGKRLVLTVRYYSENCVKEKISRIASYVNEPSAKDVLNFVLVGLTELGLDPNMLFCLVTDHSSIFTRPGTGFLHQIQNAIGRPLVKFHCILEPERLLTDISDGHLVTIANRVDRIIWILCAGSSDFQALFYPITEDNYGSCSAWNNGSRLLSTFIKSVDVVNEFVLRQNNGNEFPELLNSVWLSFLAYLVDLVNFIYKSIGVPTPTIFDLYNSWKGMSSGVELLIQDIKTETFTSFPNFKICTQSCKNETILSECTKYTINLKHELQKRLDTMSAYENVLPYLIDPLGFDVNVMDTSLFPMFCLQRFGRELRIFKRNQEMINLFSILKKNISFDSKEYQDWLNFCWFVVPDDFITLKKVALTLLSVFSSTAIYARGRFDKSPPNNASDHNNMN